MERRGGLERRPGLGASPESAQDPAQVDAAERGEPDVARRLGLRDPGRQRRGAGRVIAGLALGSAEARELVGLGLQEAEPARGLCRPAEVRDGIVEAALDARELAEHGVATDVEPGVVDDARAIAAPRRAPATARTGSPAEIAARAANSAFAA